MEEGNIIRFMKDVKYDLLVPPHGLNFRSMNAKQAKENFDWFLSKIPERINYLRHRCANDSKISIDKFDLSADSLILLWRWFIKTARMEKSSKDELEQMKKGAEIFGESFINREKFTVATQYIMRDIGMYIGQTYLSNYPQLHWHYYVKPKNDVEVNQPLLGGFRAKYMDKESELYLNPISIAIGQAANFYDKTQKETDVYNFYMKWVSYIPKQE